MEESEGIKAIIYLQAMIGKEETEEQARAGWNGMTEDERSITMKAYDMFNIEPHCVAAMSLDGKLEVKE